MIFLKVATTNRVMNVVQAYSQISGILDNESEEFYCTLEKPINQAEKGEITITLGDFNEKDWCHRKRSCRQYGLGIRNGRGE